MLHEMSVKCYTVDYFACFVVVVVVVAMLFCIEQPKLICMLLYFNTELIQTEHFALHINYVKTNFSAYNFEITVIYMFRGKKYRIR